MAFGKTELFMLISEVIVILFYGLFVVFADTAVPSPISPDSASSMYTHYPMF
jgi:hypothetical protein